MSAISDPEIRSSQGFMAVLWIVTGIVILVWPDVTVTVVAVVFGISLVLRGIAEILLSIVLGRKLKSMDAGEGLNQLRDAKRDQRDAQDDADQEQRAIGPDEEQHPSDKCDHTTHQE
jgi:hypothetical protein